MNERRKNEKIKVRAAHNNPSVQHRIIIDGWMLMRFFSLLLFECNNKEMGIFFLDCIQETSSLFQCNVLSLMACGVYVYLFFTLSTHKKSKMIICSRIVTSIPLRAVRCIECLCVCGCEMAKYSLLQRMMSHGWWSSHFVCIYSVGLLHIAYTYIHWEMIRSCASAF